MAFKQGDKVMLKNNLIVGLKYGGMKFVSDMEQQKNKMLVIRRIISEGKYSVQGDDIEYHYTDAMFRKPTMLEILCYEMGITIGEEWLANNGETYRIDEEGYLFTACEDETGLSPYIWEACTPTIPALLRGDIVPAWAPKIGDYYWLADPSEKEKTWQYRWYETPWEKEMLSRHMVFKTKKEAIETTNKMLNALKEED